MKNNHSKTYYVLRGVKSNLRDYQAEKTKMLNSPESYFNYDNGYALGYLHGVENGSEDPVLRHIICKITTAFTSHDPKYWWEKPEK